MRLGYELTIEQTQKLSMTPELIQAIQILQFNSQELTDYIQNELLENPVLEAEKPDIGEEIDIREKIAESDYELETYRQWESSADDDDNDYTYEQYVSFKYTLIDYLLGQLQFSSLKGRCAEIGRYMIEAIDDNGYLTMSVEEIAANMDASAEDVEKVLDVIQTFDPPGVGARNLRECLEIQLAAKGELDEETEFVIENMLEDLAENRISQIAKTLGIRNQDVQAIADKIRSLEPKPGRLYDSDENIKYIVPDVFVEKIDGEYVVTTNDTSMPRLMVSSYYNKLSAEAANDEELNKYLNNRFNAAV